MAETDLLPCPFCGWGARLESRVSQKLPPEYHVACLGDCEAALSGTPREWEPMPRGGIQAHWWQIGILERRKRRKAEAERDRLAAATLDATRKCMAASADGLNSAGRKMLAVLDTNPPVRRTWAQVATLARLKARGGHFNAGKKALLASGRVQAQRHD